MSRLAARALGDVVARYRPAVSLADSERERFARDPFAHLDEEETWVDDAGVERTGHIFIPDLLTVEETRFEVYEHQEDIVENWIDLDRLEATGDLAFWNQIIEKSRQMGVTWLLAYLCWWLLTYHDVNGGYSNMNKAEVDDGGEAATTDSFFGKIRYIHDRVPPRFRAPLQWRGGGTPIVRHLHRRSTYLVGRGAVLNPGRGGRYRFWIIDEAAHFPHGESAHKALARAIPHGRVYNSTPEGEDNVYFRLRSERPKGYRIVRHHWSEHPIYGQGAHVAATAPDAETGEPGRPSPQPTPEMETVARACSACRATIDGVPWAADDPVSHRYPGKLTSPWYDDAVVELTDEQVASELDIDYAASLSARVYPEFDDEIHVLDAIPYDPDLPIEFAIDYGLDTTAVAFLQETATHVLQFGELEIGDSDPDDVSAAMVATLLALGVPGERLEPYWRRQIFGVGDPSGEGREQATARPLVAEYRRNGWEIVSKFQFVSITITATKRLLRGRPKHYRVSRAACPATIRHWKLNRWPVDRDGNRKPGSQHPDDDEHNHMMRALAYYATYKFPPPAVDAAIEDAVDRARERMREGVVMPDVRYGMRF